MRYLIKFDLTIDYKRKKQNISVSKLPTRACEAKSSMLDFWPSGCILGRPWKALDNIDLNLASHRYVSGVLKDDLFVSARSLLIDRGEDYFSHKTVNKPFQFILLKSCSILNGLMEVFYYEILGLRPF